MYDMPVVDDIRSAAVAVATAAQQRHEMRATEEDLEPIVVETHAQPVADQARGHGVEYPSQHEAARRHHGHDSLLAVVGPPRRQRPQHGTPA
jgi:hypothetical protein